MNFNRAFLLAVSLLFILAFSENAICQVTVVPVGITVSMENEDTLTVEMTLTNQYEEEVAFSIDFDDPPEEEERGLGPRRDQPEGRFALFQDQNSFGWVNQSVFQRIDDIDYENFDSANDLGEADLDDFDAIWVVGTDQSDAFVRAWSDNLERFEEYVARGRSIFFEEGWNRTHLENLPDHKRESWQWVLKITG